MKDEIKQILEEVFDMGMSCEENNGDPGAFDFDVYVDRVTASILSLDIMQDKKHHPKCIKYFQPNNECGCTANEYNKLLAQLTQRIKGGK